MNKMIVLIAFVWLFFLLLILHKDIIVPPVFMVLSWTLPFLWLVVSEGISSDSLDINCSALVFIVGILVFCLGYYIQTGFKIRQYNGPIDIDDKRKMTRLFKYFILIELFLTIYFVIDVYKFVSAHFIRNFWFTYKWNLGRGYYTELSIIKYLRLAASVITCAMLIQWLSSYHSKKESFWFVTQFLLTFVINFMGSGKSGFFFFIIPIGIIFLLLKRKRSVDTIKIGVVIFLLLFLIFYIFNALKYNVGNSNKIGLKDNIQVYLCSGILNFSNWINEIHSFENGKYTFRFILALLNRIGFDTQVVSLVEPFRILWGNHEGNVYTIYKWYANDFGYIYALLWQFVIGMMHGYLNKKFYIKRNEKWLLLYAMSFFPLFMQFFMDEYISIFSSWIQIVFWTWLFSDTDIFFKLN